MKDNLSRFMLCLAALELTDNELRRLINELCSMPLEEVGARISSLRQRTQHHAVVEDAFRFPTTSSPTQFHDASVSERVEQLLKNEAGLSTAQAVEKLSLLLTELRLIEYQNVPPLSRKSLGNWVARVAQRVSAKEILRCATLLRNECVHSPVRDWALGKSE